MSRSRENVEHKDELKVIIGGAVMQLFSHPFAHAKTLMQLGYEPDKAQLHHSLFGLGKKVYYYPNVLVYCRRIKDQIGWINLFSVGLPCRLISFVLSKNVDSAMQETLRGSEASNEETIQQVTSVIGKKTVCTVCACIITQPFQVIMIRQMAQLIGHEVQYQSMFSAISEIWNTQGFSGFFSGLSARVFGDVCTLWISSLATYLVMKYVLPKNVDPTLKSLMPTVSGMFVEGFTYKFKVVSTMMAVNGSHLSVDMNFKNSTDCFTFMKSKDYLNRGSANFLRTAPITYVG